MASSELCRTCGLPHALVATVPERLPDGLVPFECLAAHQKSMADLLRNVADEGVCRGCLAPVFWLRHKNGRPTPYDASGLNHFISCPNREQFKRAKA